MRIPTRSGAWARAGLAAGLLMAACGGDDPAPGAAAPQAGSAPPPRPVVSPTPTTTAGPGGRARRSRPTGGGASRGGRPPAREDGRRKRRTAQPLPLEGAIPRYLDALNARSVAELCASYARLGRPVCGSPQARRRRRAEPSEPELLRVGLIGAPRVRIRGDRARAVVRLATVDVRGRREVRREVLHLRRDRNVWEVARPSPVFFRVLDAAA